MIIKTPDSTNKCPIEHALDDKPPMTDPTGCPISKQAAQFDPFDEPYQVNPADAMQWFRRNEPVFYCPELGYWVVTRYADIKAVYRDNITFSPAIALERITPLCPEAQAVVDRYSYAMNRTLVNEDEPIHMERRRVLMSYFEPEKLAKHKPEIKKLASEYVDRFINNGHADLVNEMLWEIPLIVAMHFLGVDESDIVKLRQFSVAHVLNTWGKPSAEEQVEVAQKVGEFWKLSGEIIEKMKANPDGEGWMYFHIRQQKKYPEIVTDSYLHSMMMAIIGAAHETTANSTSNAMRLLLSDPQVWQQLCDNPALIPNAVEECLRFEGAIVAWRRQATCETAVGGVSIPKGGKLLLVSVSGNHDEKQFENPDQLDIFRDNSSEHLTFGYGAHQCLGKNIGRMEMCIFIEEFVRRLPHMKLIDNQDFEFLPNISFKGPENLFVHWDVSKNPEQHNPQILQQRRDFAVGAPNKKQLARPAIIKEVIQETSNIKRFIIEDLQGNQLPKWSAGAHIDLIIDGFERKYSLCGDLNNTQQYEIAVLNDPNSRGGSRHIHQYIQGGMPVKIRGPKNHFQLDEYADSYLLIAAGIGITPIIAMADRLKALNKPYQIHYAGSQLINMSLLWRLNRDHGEHLSTYPKDKNTPLKLNELLSQLDSRQKVYACGPDKLIDELTQMAVKWPENTLHTEYFSSAIKQLDGANEHAFDVTLSDSDITLSVPANKTLLQALHDIGIDVQNDCNEGLCGSCECIVNEGEIDHRDKVLTQQERQQGDRMMPCCSRAKGQHLTLAL